MANVSVGELNPVTPNMAGYIPSVLNMTGWQNFDGTPFMLAYRDSAPVSPPDGVTRNIIYLTMSGSTVTGVRYVTELNGVMTQQFQATGLSIPLATLQSGFSNIIPLVFAGDDVINGNNFENVLYGLAGNDTINGLGGNDTLFGGAGSDKLYGGDGDDILLPGYGTGLNSNDVVDGGAGTDTISLADIAGSGTPPKIEGFIDLASGVAGIIDYNYYRQIVVSFTLTSIENATGTNGEDLIYGNAGANVLSGLNGADFLYGGAGADTLYGGAGDDTLFGGAGADLLSGGDGFDIANYSASTAAVTVNLTTNLVSGGDAAGDILNSIEGAYGSIYNDSLTGSASADKLSGNDGNDSIYGNGGNDTLQGGLGNDALYGGGGNDILTDNGGSDLLYGGAGDDILDPGAVMSSEWQDIVDGGDGSDTVSFSNIYSTVTIDLAAKKATLTSIYTTINANLISIENATGSSGDDVLIGDAGANRLDGGYGNDSLNGGAGNDVLNGGGGSDILDGGAGNDILSPQLKFGSSAADIVNGGDGIDTISFASEFFDNFAGSGFVMPNVSVDLALGTATGLLTGPSPAFIGATLTSIENVTGGIGNDTLLGDTGANTLSGLAGNDILNGREGNDILIGGAGADQLTGGLGSDTASYAGSAAAVDVNLSISYAAFGDAAGDLLTGIENLTGSAGGDTLIGDGNANVIEGGAGADWLSGLGGIDTLSYASNAAGGVSINLQSRYAAYGDAQGDSIFGFENVTGSQFSDWIFGDTGVNVLNGGAGNDVLMGGTGADALIGGAGIDTVLYTWAASAVDVNLWLNAGSLGESAGDTLSGIENLTGSAYNDALIGNDANNVLDGGAGDDWMSATGGSDTLRGGAGNDTLLGGTGSDLFLFDAALNAATNRDTIADFSVVDDTVQLENSIFTLLATTGTLAAGLFKDLSLGAQDANDAILYDRATGNLIYDSNGLTAGGQTIFADVTDGLALTSADFLVI